MTGVQTCALPISIDYENEFPGQVTKNEDELIKAITAVNGETENDNLKRQRFTDKMYKFRDGKSTDRVLDLIESIMAG